MARCNSSLCIFFLDNALDKLGELGKSYEVSNSGSGMGRLQSAELYIIDFCFFENRLNLVETCETKEMSTDTTAKNATRPLNLIVTRKFSSN